MTQQGTPLKNTDDVLRDALKNQYHAALKMLREAIELCPDELWFRRPDDGRAFWLTAYHALYYTHLYLELDEAETIEIWDLNQTGIQDIDDVPVPPDLEDEPDSPHWPPQPRTPYTPRQLLDYWRACDSLVDEALDEFDILADSAGLRWPNPPRPLLERHVDAIRHLQHHTSQLCDALRTAAGACVQWVSTCRPAVTDPLERMPAEGE